MRMNKVSSYKAETIIPKELYDWSDIQTIQNKGGKSDYLQEKLTKLQEILPITFINESVWTVYYSFMTIIKFGQFLQFHDYVG